MDDKLLLRLRGELSILSGLGDQVVSDFSQLALKYLTQDVPSNIYNTASQKLQIDRKLIENAVTGTACLFFEAVRVEVTEEQFLESSVQLGLDAKILSVIYQIYLSGKDVLDTVLKLHEEGLPQYNGLQWRLESQLGTRSRQGSLKPQVILRLDLNNSLGKHESVALRSDIPNIVRWSQLVEDAIAESRTHHSRKVHRAVS